MSDNKMDGDQKHAVLIILLIVFLVVSLISAIATYHIINRNQEAATIQSFINDGYEQVLEPGRYEQVWKKVKN